MTPNLPDQAAPRNRFLFILLYPFWNRAEKRVRTLWRLVLQIAVMVPIFLLFNALFTDALEPYFKPAIVSSAIQTLAIGGSAWLLARLLDRRSFRDFGFQMDGAWWWDFAYGLGLGIVLMSAIFLLEYNLGWVTVTDNYWDQLEHFSFPLAFVFSIFFFANVGFHEELLSRGYQMVNLAEGFHLKFCSRKVAVWVALLLTSSLFGFGHAGNPEATFFSTANIVLAGLMLGLSYLVTGRLGLAVGFHISWNFFQGIVYGFPVSGLSERLPAKLLVLEQAGPDLLTGGKFGPEGGVVGLISLILGTILILLWAKYRYGRVQIQPELLGYPPKVQADLEAFERANDAALAAAEPVTDPLEPEA